MKRVRQEASTDRTVHTGTRAPTPRGGAPRSSRSRGEPLSADVRAGMEPRFAHDFAKVRVHADPAADHLARDFDAAALTLGTDVYFRAGTFEPGEARSAHLLAHELAHVAQAADAGGTHGELSAHGDAAEQNAWAAAGAALVGDPVSVGSAAPAAVARAEGEEYESVPGQLGEAAEAPKAITGINLPGFEGASGALGFTGGIDRAMHADNGVDMASGLMSAGGGALQVAGWLGDKGLMAPSSFLEAGGTLGETAGTLGAAGGFLGAGASALDAYSDFSKGNYGRGVYDTAKAASGTASSLATLGGFEATGDILTSGAGSALFGGGGEGLAMLGPAGLVAGAGLAGAGIGTELYQHTSVGEHSRGALGTLDSWLSGDSDTPWSQRTTDAMSEDWGKGNLSSLSGVGNYAKSIGNAAELGLFGLGGAVGGLAGGVADAGEWAGGKIADAAGAVGSGVSDAASFVGGGISDAASAVWDWL